MAASATQQRKPRPGDRHRPRHMSPIPPDLWQQAAAEAKALERPVSWVIQRRLRESYATSPAAQQ